MVNHAISEARAGMLSNEDDIARIDRIVSPQVRNRQFFRQII